jgi:hypothetical protein
MNMKLIGTVAAVVLFGLGARASATTVDLGEISAGESNGGAHFVSTPATSIDDTWSFTLTETLLTAIVIDSADLAPFFGIDGLTAVGSDASISFAYDVDDNAYTFTGVLAAGTYDFNVTGTTSGSLGGQYEVIVGGVSAVPVPAAFWLFSGALLLVLRRTSNAPAKS